MSTTVQQIIDEARTQAHDLPSDNYVRDFLQEQANGVNLVFQLRNRNVVQEADGAPADLVALVNNVVAVITSVDEATGLVTLESAPPSGSLAEFRYYFVLNPASEYLNFVKTASRFIGNPPTFTVATDNVQFGDTLAPAAITYVAYLASTSMANLSHWYYAANAGNKSFNKAEISRKFSDQAKEKKEEARALRMDVMQRFDQVSAPAYRNTAQRGVRLWEPQR